VVLKRPPATALATARTDPAAQPILWMRAITAVLPCM